MSTDNYSMPFSAIGNTRPANGYLAFPESHRRGGSIQTRVRLPEGICTIQVSTTSNRLIMVRHVVDGVTTEIGRLEPTTGGGYRTSAPVRVVASSDTTELNIGVSPFLDEDEPVEYVGIVVVPIAPPPAA